jgi:hypothetical protein
MPESCESLGLQARFSREEFAKIKVGHVSQDMDDKWDIGFEDPWLLICRSWSGHCIYKIRIMSDDASATIAESWVNRDPMQYQLTNLDYDRRFSLWLINRRLLGNDDPAAPSPIREMSSKS